MDRILFFYLAGAGLVAAVDKREVDKIAADVEHCCSRREVGPTA